jgi:predicted membrane protein
MIVLSALLAAGLALLHLYVRLLSPALDAPRSPWLSLAGGAATAYVFVHIFPSLCDGQDTLLRAGWAWVAALDRHVFLIALAGLLVFYALERAALGVRGGRDTPPVGPGQGVFWLHLTSFGLYNFLIGYLLVNRVTPGPASLVTYFLAMALHMAGNDYGLRRHFTDSYRHLGRLVLAGAVLAGWGFGVAFRVHDAVLAILFAFLAGGVIMNTMKDELPLDGSGNAPAFTLGAAGYAALLLLV